jgi:NAD(P)-dependent dehydrogenase (short-subunit alcohol dehydrogenase family)
MQLFDLTGKTALITGASSGLGESFARCLSKAGARVILASRNFVKLQDLAKSLGNALPLEMDVSDKNSVAGAFNRLENANEKIDICINNAGIEKHTPIFQPDQNADFESVIQTNLMGVWFVTKAVSNHMKNHGIHGSIINIGSVNGDAVPAKEWSAYSVSKAAVMHLTKTLTGELSPHNIRINSISPGWFKTPMTEADIDTIAPYVPCGSVADALDLDGLVLYLASNMASRYVTGSCFTIDGGISWGGLRRY